MARLLTASAFALAFGSYIAVNNAKLQQEKAELDIQSSFPRGYKYFSSLRKNNQSVWSNNDESNTIKETLTQKTVAIIGGGVVGVTSAYYLAKAGYKVKLIEKETKVSQQTSWGNAGALRLSEFGNIAAFSTLQLISSSFLPSFLKSTNNNTRNHISHDGSNDQKEKLNISFYKLDYSSLLSSRTLLWSIEFLKNCLSPLVPAKKEFSRQLACFTIAECLDVIDIINAAAEQQNSAANNPNGSDNNIIKKVNVRKGSCEVFDNEDELEEAIDTYFHKLMIYGDYHMRFDVLINSNSCSNIKEIKDKVKKVNKAIIERGYKNGVNNKISCINIKELHDVEPSLASSTLPIAGAINFKNDYYFQCTKFCDSLVALSTSKYNVELLTEHEAVGVEYATDTTNTNTNDNHGNKITAIITNKGKIEADYFVFCLGPFSYPIIDKLLLSNSQYTPINNAKLNLPAIYPLKGYSMTIDSLHDTSDNNNDKQDVMTDNESYSNKFIKPKQGIIIDHLFISPYDEEVRFTSYGILSKDTVELEDKYINELKGISKIVPTIGDYSKAKYWLGRRPLTPDALPIIDRLPTFSNCFINAGHGTVGVKFSCASASILTAIISQDNLPAQDVLNFVSYDRWTFV